MIIVDVHILGSISWGEAIPIASAFESLDGHAWNTRDSGMLEKYNLIRRRCLRSRDM